MALYNRIVYMKEAERLLNGIDPHNKDCGEISGNLGRKFKFKSFQRFDFPEYDVCADPFVDDAGQPHSFDVIIADQVWEHLDRPYRATQNVLSMLRDGGYFYVCVPFYVRYHAYPVDCSRWTARGLKNLLIEAGFDEEKIQADQWGNLTCARKECGYRFARFDPATDTLENDPKFPIIAWALGQK
ncbi:methyltransferase domain-containing protein [Actibacterium ureilyticum]|uniref:methyltransferase domain-containing protein n=1 Tax=Actibacterium ureilyticum TaxID=1590614 RepID=UPI000BAAE7B8|nr:methyltransferase domain-containing protein [Actibacterium ureilyticum]